MCGRFTTTAAPKELTKHIGQQLGVQIRETIKTDPWDIRPTQQVLTIIAPEGEPEATMLRWSLVPWWATELKTRRPMFNARIEGLIEKNAYAKVPLDELHRGLILGDGFFEWEHPEDKKQKGQPYRFTVDGGRPFAFPCIWTNNKKIEHGPVESCTMITCDSAPNPLVHKVHDRMPGILTELEEFRAWLSPDVAAQDALSLITAFPAERMSVEARQPGRA
jgi:putative SOS response-associated peptidase YedK